VGAALRFAPRNWLKLRVTPGSTEAYAIAVACVAIAALVRGLLGLIDNDILPLTTFFPAVLIAALAGGTQAGILATTLGGIIARWAFMPPYYSFVPLTPGQSISLVTYAVAALIIVWGADHYCTLATRLENEEELRKLAVEELAHRLKNKIATIQAVISSKLRDNPQLRGDIQGLLQALSATDELVMKSQGRGANIQDIIETEVKPYDRSRIYRAGPAVFLPPSLAMTMGLVVHELTTNAAKYGALSTPLGRVAITWSVSDGRLTVDWRESDGPKVSPSTVAGFGTRLLGRALDQFGGTIVRKFEQTGLVCKMSLNLPLTSDIASPSAGSEDGATVELGERKGTTNVMLELKSAQRIQA
jgi:two-component sensor histidine kinase